MKNRVKQILLKIFSLKTIPGLIIAYCFDFKAWIVYSLSNSREKRLHRQAELLLLLHSLEKGLSFKTIKVGFGRDNAIYLLKKTKQYLSIFGVDEVALMSLGVLRAYVQEKQSGHTLELKNGIEEVINLHQISNKMLLGGVKSISKESIDFQQTFEDLYQFVSSRHSVRDFSSISILDAEIEKAILYAHTAPSVCNRQACRIHVFEEEQIQLILDTQLGNQGWAHKANKLFVVTSDLHFFGGIYERNQPYIDGGMFSMQFVMGMHAQKIATCCKMYIRNPKLDALFYKATGIPKNEVPIMLILAGHYADDVIKVPVSHRLVSIRNYNE